MKRFLEKFLVGFFVLLSAALSAEAPLRRALIEMTDMSERRIRQSLQDYLGPGQRVVVEVYLQEKSREAQVSAPTASQANSSDSWMLSSPYAVNSENFGSNSQADAPFEIGSAEVTLHVAASLESSQRSVMEDLAKGVLRGIPTKVKILATLKPSSQAEDGQRSPASQQEGLGAQARPWEPFIPVAAAFVIFLGILGASFFLRGSLHTLTEGLKSLRTSVSNTGSQSISLTTTGGFSNEKNNGDRRDQASIPEGARASSETSRIEIDEGLARIEAYLSQSPVLLLSSLSDEAPDLVGLKFLVSRFSDSARLQLKKLMGEARLGQVASFVTPTHFDAASWMQSLIEKIELKKLAGAGPLEKALSSDDFLRLSGVAPHKLLKAALDLDTPQSWRVALDLVPAELMQSHLKAADSQKWLAVIKGAKSDASEDLSLGAKRLLGAIEALGAHDGEQTRLDAEREHYFKQRLLPSLVDAVSRQNFGQDEEFLDLVVREAPEFESLVRSEVWTCSRLHGIEEASLRSSFLALDHDRKASLIVAFPEDHAKRLESFIPEGNIKKIVLDRVSRLKASDDVVVREQARALARQFLNWLREEALQGRILLKSSGAPSGSVAREELLKAS